MYTSEIHKIYTRVFDNCFYLLYVYCVYTDVYCVYTDVYCVCTIDVCYCVDCLRMVLGWCLGL